MADDARQVANWFVTRARQDGRSLSIMSLLKLTYIAHGWYLESRNEPLFPNRIEAWQYGPVVPEVYSDFRRQGIRVHTPVNTVTEYPFTPEDTALLEQVWEIYGSLPAFRLSDITHVPNGPWDVASRMRGHYARIPDDLIRNHYVELRMRAEAAANA